MQLAAVPSGERNSTFENPKSSGKNAYGMWAWKCRWPARFECGAYLAAVTVADAVLDLHTVVKNTGTKSTEYVSSDCCGRAAVTDTRRHHDKFVFGAPSKEIERNENGSPDEVKNEERFLDNRRTGNTLGDRCGAKKASTGKTERVVHRTAARRVTHRQRGLTAFKEVSTSEAKMPSLSGGRRR
ncbi:hypothetical protein C8F04DRAFT_1238092 [Mycena alexandri]|uniref:Uncharacterized protein n=1 Tax=Mycena alexandri TaxID=1745969 RepID=A0AAD6SH58_9AGAR|nr:hypothetical protein C8F04DRAFT_1238092 [Mycena alexandri]